MKIGKGNYVMDFRGQRRRRKKKKKKRSVGERRRAATGAGHPSTVGWSNAALARRWHVSPAKPSWTANASRAEPNRTDPRLRKGCRACGLRLAHCWRVSARETAVLARLPSICPIFCPGSSFNIVFMWIGT